MEKDTEVLQAQTVKEDFWSRDDAQEVLRKLARLQERAQQWSEVSAELEELILLSDLLGETSDADLEGEFYRRSAALKKTMEKRQLTLLLNDEYDENDAILTIHPGAGGMDSADWADMLHRMYLRWAEIEGFQTTILDLSPDIEAGIKSATVLVKGAFAYGTSRQSGESIAWSVYPPSTPPKDATRASHPWAWPRKCLKTRGWRSVAKT